MARMNGVVRGVLVMVTFAVLGQGCCGRRKPPKDAAAVTLPASTPAPAAPTTE